MTGRGVPVAESLLLAVWIGAATLFALVVAPAAFAVLPTRTLAGALVGRVLPVIFYSGVVIGSIIAIVDLMGRTGSWGRTAAGAVLALACAVAQLVVGSRIEQLRVAIGGPLDALAADDPRRLAFGRLHAISVGWLGIAMVAAIIALWLAARSLTPRNDAVTPKSAATRDLQAAAE